MGDVVRGDSEQNTNEPAMVKHVHGKVAEIKQISVEEVDRITTENPERFFERQAC